ncbi:hypothetical protein AGMMS49940_06950 [Spirochaetia bacterium]|nr:hypothetical protein AGMMS49940_06950 [Spirochaetia bacterium]
MQTSVPGNESGFVLLDALFCLFTAALILLLISGAVSSALNLSSKTFAAGISIIEERNDTAARIIDGGELHEK